jgi:hypothetical protein
LKLRKVTSLTAMVSFLVLIVNSVVLYIVPQGRVSHWADWRVLGLTKEEWGDQHIIIGVLFLLAVFLHTFYNWKPFVSYLKNKARQFRLFTGEFNIALILTVVCIVGAYFAVPPFSWVLDLGTSIKGAAAVKYGEPPYSQAENSTLKDFTRRMGYDLAESIERLKKAGIRFESETQTLREIARTNRLSPQKVYLTIKPSVKESREAGAVPEASPKGTAKQPPAETPVTGTPSGLGSKTVAAVCEAYGIPQAEALKKLAAKGIAANPDDKMKSLAEKYGKLPTDLYEIMK